MEKLFNTFIYTYLFFITFYAQSQNYKVTYSVSFSPSIYDLSKTAKERTTLIIYHNKKSIFASENFLKKDSISALLDKGIINSREVIGNSKAIFKTLFNSFIIKDYDQKKDIVFSRFSFSYYKYTQKKELIWILLNDTLKIHNYLCYKATTKFEGRDYVAWYAPEVPISDGPYKFSGLPGLIIEISDTEKHYNFKLEKLGKYLDKPIESPYFEPKSLDISYEKFKIIDKEYRENPLKQLSDRGVKLEGEAPPPINRERLFTNPIERF
jgi:GLPGLI family protein